jgi:hypothetical protein
MGCLLLCVAALSIDFTFYKDGSRFLLSPQDPLTKEAAVNLEIRTLKVLYWRNRIHGAMGQWQFRTVGWQFEAGVGLGPAEVYFHHHSQHLLDSVHPWARFPVEDAIGVRVNLIWDYKRDGLFLK